MTWPSQKSDTDHLAVPVGITVWSSRLLAALQETLSGRAKQAVTTAILSSCFRGKFHADGLVSGIVTIPSLCSMLNIFYTNLFSFKTMLCPRSCSSHLQAHRLNILKHHLSWAIPCRHLLVCFLLSPGPHFLVRPAASLLLCRLQSAVAATLGMPRCLHDVLRLLCLPSEWSATQVATLSRLVSIWTKTSTEPFNSVLISIS